MPFYISTAVWLLPIVANPFCKAYDEEMGSNSTSKIMSIKEALAQVFRERFAENPEATSITFSLRDLGKGVLRDPDGLKRELDRIQKALEPDFAYHFLQRDSISGTADVDNRRPSSVVEGVKIIIDNKTKLDDYLLRPESAKNLYFDAVKSRLYIKGTEIKIAKFRDQYHALRIIFEDPTEVGKNWFFSELVERIDPHKPNEKTYYNAVHQVRLKAKSEGFKDFFITTKQSVQINPKYLS